MKRGRKKDKAGKGMALIVSIVLIFCILGIFVFYIAGRISREMSQGAVDNLSESLDLIRGTIEAILDKEAEFQKLIGEEIGMMEEPEKFIQSYRGNDTMVKLSLVPAGEAVGISNIGEEFDPEELDFSSGKKVGDLPISSSYVNHMGAWAYTLKCPVIREGKEVAALYVEYIYESFDKALPNRFYNSMASLYIMDAESERLVLKPKGMGEREAGHVNLEDFYRANQILEEDVKQEITESVKAGRNVMFYHDVQRKKSLIYMWAVNGGTIYLIGYVPVEAIQREGSAVNQNIFVVVAVMLIAFLICCALYFFTERQRIRARKEREKERELHNKQLAEALQAAQVASKSKTMFLSNMSHDIRTPMNAILGFTTLLAKDAENPEKVREYTGKITASGRHLLSLINDVLDVSKIESGKVVLTIDEFTLSDMVSAVDAIIRPAAKAKNQAFEVTVRGIKHERLTGDETRLNQILINLLSNAVKYTQEGGNIWFRMIGLEQRSSQYEHIRIEVEDNGYGMTPEYLETIFDAFTRAENSTTNKVQGTGLGMAITKSIVELMGGTIQVTSEVNKGSLFTVELELRIPKECAEQKPRQQQEEAVEADHLEGCRFLVAEDNEINAEILEQLLELEGAECEIAVDGQSVLERFQQAAPGEFDAILMDVQMPKMNGYEAAKAIRGLDREDAASVPIIAMTANAFAEDVKDALAAGMNAHIAKPVDMGLLKKTVNQYVQRKG